MTAPWKPLLALLVTSAALAEEALPDLHFLDQVKPLLESRCVSCHGADKARGGLRLDSLEAALQGGDSGAALKPGNPSESLLFQAVLHTAPDLEMPPKEKLTERDIAVLRQWIEQGAVWPEAPRASETLLAAEPGERLGDAWTDPRNPIVRLFGGQRLELWSLQAVTRPQLPAVRNNRAIRNPIDRFVVARLEEEGLEPTSPADRRALIRRVHLDLVGVPPAPGEVAVFVAAARPDAYEQLVDRLLASPRYGEHWGRQWLDVIRYSDSNGFDWDEFRPQAWRFRDYVVRAINSDKPFDQFVREQLAGDETLEGAPRTPEEQDRLIATGYLRLGPHDNSASLFNEQARSRAELMADLVETTGSAFLGMTLSCNRCHDHKYDPLSHADHFRLRAFFEPVKFMDDLPLDLAHDQIKIREHNEVIEAQIKPLQQEQEKLIATVRQRIREERIASLSPEDRSLLQTSLDQRNEDQKAQIAALEKQVTPGDKDLPEAFTEAEKPAAEKLSKQIDTLSKRKQPFTHGLVMGDGTQPPPVTRLLFQGDYKQEREAVEPGFLSILDPNPADIAKVLNPNSTGRRSTLANWIASEQNPLTARVLVNRIWQGHFGTGLVATPNDFGLAGARPSHPELLDWLADEFMRSGWSIKKMHRLILTSATYRQASSPALSEQDSEPFAKAARIDSENRLLWRQNLRRLTAEQLRDSLLSVSGALLDKPGGVPVWPEIPAEILQANPAFLDDNAEKTKGWYPSKAEQQNVRSLYLVQKRTVRVPFMETFDLPENTVSCGRRDQSIVAPQALSLLNSDAAVEVARALSKRVQALTDDPELQARHAFALALQRMPAPEEAEACQELLRERSLVELCRALLNLNEFVYLD